MTTERRTDEHGADGIDQVSVARHRYVGVNRGAEQDTRHRTGQRAGEKHLHGNASRGQARVIRQLRLRAQREDFPPQTSARQDQPVKRCQHADHQQRQWHAEDQHSADTRQRALSDIDRLATVG